MGLRAHLQARAGGQWADEMRCRCCRGCGVYQRWSLCNSQWVHYSPSAQSLPFFTSVCFISSYFALSVCSLCFWLLIKTRSLRILWSTFQVPTSTFTFKGPFNPNFVQFLTGTRLPLPLLWPPLRVPCDACCSQPKQAPRTSSSPLLRPLTPPKPHATPRNKPDRRL